MYFSSLNTGEEEEQGEKTGLTDQADDSHRSCEQQDC